MSVPDIAFHFAATTSRNHLSPPTTIPNMPPNSARFLGRLARQPTTFRRCSESFAPPPGWSRTLELTPTQRRKINPKPGSASTSIDSPKLHLVADPIGAPVPHGPPFFFLTRLAQSHSATESLERRSKNRVSANEPLPKLPKPKAVCAAVGYDSSC
jgi:hypothetical protein